MRGRLTDWNGFARADGEILGTLNADDILLPKALHTVAQYFLANPDVDVVSGQCRIIDASGNLIRDSYSDSFHPRRVMYRAASLMQPSTSSAAAPMAKPGDPMSPIAWIGTPNYLSTCMLREPGSLASTPCSVHVESTHPPLPPNDPMD